MYKVKITVFKITLDKELIDKYGIENLSTCPFQRLDQVFFEDYAKPESFCD